MYRVGLIDFDGKIPNLVLMKISSYYKNMGAEVHLAMFPYIQFPKNIDKVYCSVLFTWNKQKASTLTAIYQNIEFGGTGWDEKIKLPAEIEQCVPDYTLYTAADLVNRIKGIMTKERRLRKATELCDMGVGFTARGCVRNCSFCVVPKKEGKLHQCSDITHLINHESNKITLLDNNFTADPYRLDKLEEIRQRNLIIDISQGIDVRLLDEPTAIALSKIKHLRSIHYAWDLIEHEQAVIEGIRLLSKYIKPYRQMCFMLVGYNTTFEEDYYRFIRLTELNVAPYVMIYNKEGTLQLHHFARWVNGRVYKADSWDNYLPWVRDRLQPEIRFNDII